MMPRPVTLEEAKAINDAFAELWRWVKRKLAPDLSGIEWCNDADIVVGYALKLDPDFVDDFLLAWRDGLTATSDEWADWRAFRDVETRMKQRRSFTEALVNARMMA